jgi:hypothetical protein
MSRVMPCSGLPVIFYGSGQLVVIQANSVLLFLFLRY